MRLLKIAHKNSERLVRLINDILDIEKIESGKVRYDLKRVEVRPLIGQAIEANRGFAESYGVRLVLDPGSAPAFVRADPDRLVQVVTNLLSNAIKFSPRDEEVQVAIERRIDDIRITVRDHGIGIAEEFKQRIFEKFAQGNASDTRQKGGTGLGLSIVKQIVTFLGGTVGFDIAAGGGTIFHVELPNGSSARARTQPRVTQRAHVLICDDDAGVAKTIAARLELTGFIVDTALSARRRAQAGAGNALRRDHGRSQAADRDGISLIKICAASRNTTTRRSWSFWPTLGAVPTTSALLA
jgi:two-component sensor histidine kinase